MKIFKDIGLLQAYLDKLRSSYCIGFVPTMGALHKGHLSLVDHAKKTSDIVVVSIFVNPTQFGPNEDFSQYPRTLDEDIKVLQENKVDILFCPTIDTIYPKRPSLVKVSIPEWDSLYCGKTRPAFFQGVCAVVLRLFNIIKPNSVIFGEKDFQQYKIIQRLVAELFLPITIICQPIIRETSGLAMSSRNKYLTSSQLIEAASIYKSLTTAKIQFKHGKVRSVSEIKTLILNQLSDNISLDYCVIIDPDSLKETREPSHGNRILFAGYLNKTRLIDTIEI